MLQVSYLDLATIQSVTVDRYIRRSGSAPWQHDRAIVVTAVIPQKDRPRPFDPGPRQVVYDTALGIARLQGPPAALLEADVQQVLSAVEANNEVRGDPGPEDGRTCGPDALLYLGRLSGMNLLPEAVRAQFRGLDGSSGTSLLEIRDAARRLGLHPVVAFEASAEFGTMRLPALIHLGGSHFVVVASRRADLYTVVDPPRFVRRLTRGQIEAAWTGHTMRLRVER